MSLSKNKSVDSSTHAWCACCLWLRTGSTAWTGLDKASGHTCFITATSGFKTTCVQNIAITTLQQLIFLLCKVKLSKLGPSLLSVTKKPWSSTGLYKANTVAWLYSMAG